MRYDILGPPPPDPPAYHPLASDDLRALPRDQQVAHVDLAEGLLAAHGGLRVGDAPAYTAAEEAQARIAVALQASLQVASGVEAFAFSSEGLGPISTSYRGTVVHPQALALVQQLPPAEEPSAAPLRASTQAVPLQFVW